MGIHDLVASLRRQAIRFNFASFTEYKPIQVVETKQTDPNYSTDILKILNEVRITCTTILERSWIRYGYTKVEKGFPIEEPIKPKQRRLDIDLMLIRLNQDSIDTICEFIGHPVNFAWNWLELERAAIHIFHLNPKPRIRIRTNSWDITYREVFSESTQKWILVGNSVKFEGWKLHSYKGFGGAKSTAREILDDFSIVDIVDSPDNNRIGLRRERHDSLLYSNIDYLLPWYQESEPRQQINRVLRHNHLDLHTANVLLVVDDLKVQKLIEDSHSNEYPFLNWVKQKKQRKQINGKKNYVAISTILFNTKIRCHFGCLLHYHLICLL
jgi:hypothetical protein